jgi:hypothetical protein
MCINSRRNSGCVITWSLLYKAPPVLVPITHLWLRPCSNIAVSLFLQIWGLGSVLKWKHVGNGMSTVIFSPQQQRFSEHVAHSPCSKDTLSHFAPELLLHTSNGDLFWLVESGRTHCPLQIWGHFPLCHSQPCCLVMCSLSQHRALPGVSSDWHDRDAFTCFHRLCVSWQ